MNLWGCDLLQQWNTQINIPPISEANHTLTYFSGDNIRRHYTEHSLTIQVVKGQRTTAADLSKALTALTLKWLTENPVWVEKSSLKIDKF